MTHKDKLEALSKDIRSKLPELREISAGCKFSHKNHPNTVSIVDYSDDEYIQSNCNAYRLDSGFYDDFILIGHEIQLHHVLKCLGVLNKVSISIDVNGCISEEEYNGESGEVQYEYKGIVWNLDKPLKDQSEQLIDYLYSLIK